MSLIDDILGPRDEHVVDDTKGGRWVVSMRPRRVGSPVVRNSFVSFRRLGARRSSGFGVKAWVLESVARPDVWWAGSGVEPPLGLTRELAQAAMVWINELREE